LPNRVLNNNPNNRAKTARLDGPIAAILCVLTNEANAGQPVTIGVLAGGARLSRNNEMDTSTNSSSSSRDGVVGEVNGLKEALLKELPAESDVAVERCQDILAALQKIPMTLDILTETLVGATVNKLKTHKTLGSSVKELVQRWKELAKVNPNDTTTSNTKKKKKQTAEPSAAERRASDSSHNGGDAEYKPEAEWSSLPSHRSSICQKLYDIFLTAKPTLVEQEGVAESVILPLLGPRAAELEQAIQNFGRNDRKKYMDKARSIGFNLKQNTKLAVSLLLGHLDAASLVSMSAEELASDDVRKQREMAAQKLVDSKRLDWDRANESKINQQCGISGDALQASLFTCGRCKSIKTTSTQKQTRSADEPMTVFVLCLNCGKRWKC
jgi:transcription elongation factor S-II